MPVEKWDFYFLIIENKNAAVTVKAAGTAARINVKYG